MPDEIMKAFLEQVIDCCCSFSDALTLALEYYNVSAVEKEFIMDTDRECGGDFNGTKK